LSRAAFTAFVVEPFKHPGATGAVAAVAPGVVQDAPVLYNLRKRMESDEASEQQPAQALAETLVSVWQQVMVEDRGQVRLGEKLYPVSATGGKRLRKVDFAFGGRDITGIEQNPRTTSQWAQMARRGVRVMQFTEGRRYLANVADGKLTLYR
jgi:hypothetical protein